MRLYAESTRVPVSKTRAEIENLLTRYRAKQFGTAVDYDIGKARVQFRLEDRIVRFVISLPDKKKLGDGERYERAERQRWRALLLVLKAKLESVTNGIETFEEAFLAHVVLPNDQTVADVVRPQIAESYASGRMPRQLTAAAGIMTTYRDGIGGQRCSVCYSMLRNGAGDPMVSVRVDDLEEIACLLVDYVDCPQVWGPTIQRMEQAVGRTVAQMKADARAKLKGVPDGGK